jgi:DNA processing protein
MFWVLRLARMNSIITIKHSSPHYPRRFLDLPDAPKEIYCRGNLAMLSLPTVAIVGSRKASQEGINNALMFSESIVNKGFCVISGLAEGIDTAAHVGALKARPLLSTIAICGTGLDRCYPPKNLPLFETIGNQGLLISEYPPGSIIKPHFFRQRNRLIAAMSLGVLIVEGALKSGSLTTANYANELGREVFAIPNSIHKQNSAGCLHLIKEGAKLTCQPSDIFDELKPVQPLNQ